SDCKMSVPSSTGESQAAGSSLIGAQLVYECAVQTQVQSGSLLEIFTKAYGSSIASLLEMKITTSAACVARSWYGGPMRFELQRKRRSSLILLSKPNNQGVAVPRAGLCPMLPTR